MTSMSCSVAHTFTGEGVTVRPRPCGLSGSVMMSAGVRPASCKLSSTRTESVGVPKNANSGEVLSIIFDCLVYKEYTMQVVDLVLDYLCQEVGAVVDKFYPMFVVSFDRNLFVSQDSAKDAAH